MLDGIQNIVNFLFAPEYLVTISIVALLLFFYYRKIATQNKIVATLVVTSPLIFFAISALEENFWIQFKRPDNIPIAIMMFLVMFFTWFAMKKAVENDASRG